MLIGLTLLSEVAIGKGAVLVSWRLGVESGIEQIAGSSF